MAERRKVRPDCIYVSNPFHECSDYCIKKTAESKAGKDKKSKGSFRLDISKSFGRKKGSRPKPPKEHDGGQYSSTVFTEARSFNSRISPKKNVESRIGGHISPTKRFYSEEIHPEDPSLSVEQLDTPRIPSYDSLIMPDYSEDAPKKSPIRIPPPMTNNENGGENHETFFEDCTPNGNNGKERSRKQSSESSFSMSGFEQTQVDSDEGEIESVNSEVCVPVGKYHVKSSFSSILTSIFEKYGDIAATCKLESVSMRSYYLECVCYVIQELQSTEFHQLTKSKVKELLAIFKDVESSEIDVTWLKSRLNEIAQAVELRTQHRAIEAAKTDCEQNLESIKKELESQMADLKLKEKELSEAKTKVAETRARLSELELKSSQLKEMITSIDSKVENFRCKSFSDDLL
ncbi:uncharacterized protein LOC120077998 [Benincasa hispida]|uniref:uncharacterized protein LOC120077998 n=1 Tax=Benincasa hispida TaxID=102211 RepID=UPI0018FF8B30|nr:uncharacterized protein LOC120077998 [Benincasa hispida]XP_038888083.1 uncharacterized protein LOC120077998 [Benincasa hispida]XP_038888084.1 uncharacterized protein LOC120077998 [Benincasa hispida]XP_038888085.1 uncharacterized protein LOC120077998 [Benincasa hispida]XP_038888086.1 uncharacterized protein LOC120077998 [Benincasa hispida]XP_038888087.1 uncharacterized protein LOC120077998 [Benincasa hispida]XP_038888088.1 uncharacterized protein LOC120077998 [Benincasa hispida]XP_03888808